VNVEEVVELMVREEEQVSGLEIEADGTVVLVDGTGDYVTVMLSKVIEL